MFSVSSRAVAHLYLLVAPILPLSSSRAQEVGNTPRAAAGVCRARTDAQHKLRLANGDVPWVSPSSHARHLREWFVAGSPAMVFPSAAPATFVPRLDSFVGLMYSGAGPVRMVPNPLPGRPVLFPRVVATRRGWHALLFESRFPDDGVDHPTDTVRVWYAEYSVRGWRRLRQVASLTRSRYRPEFTSQLVSDGRGGLAFVYALGVSSTSQEANARGIVLLHSTGDAWTADTLPTPQPVAYATLAAGTRPGSWSVLYQMRIIDSARVAMGSLFLTSFDSTWRSSTLEALGRYDSLNGPTLLRIGSDLYATWQQDSAGLTRQSKSSVRWAPLVGSGTLDALAAPVVAADADDYQVAQLENGTPIWALRDFTSSRRVRLVHAPGVRAADAGTIAAPNEASMALFSLSGHRMLMLTAHLGRKGEPPVQQIATTFTIGCS